jgi:tetratricopeptide (TPR) repeat protein
MLGGCAAPEPEGPLAPADEHFLQGDYARALTDYRIALNRGLPADEQEKALFRLGAAYYQMKAYADAKEALQEYLDRYPAGVYSARAQRVLEVIHDQWEQRQEERAEEYRVLMKQIEEQEQAAEETPRDPKAHYELADLYWRAGLWNSSAREYAVAMRDNPAYEMDPLVVARVQMQDDGTVVPKKPIVGSDIFGNEGPLRIESTKSGIESELDYRGESRIVLISGWVVNRSVRTYGPVSVQVSLLDLNDAVINSRVVPVGRIDGGERSRFDARLLVYGSALNVQRYECKLIYPR